MSNDKITGVFVRLPLDESQIMKLYNPKKPGNENLLAIGTPVTGGDVPVIGTIHIGENGNPFFTSPELHSVGGDVVRQSDAQVQIAALEAEVHEEQRISNLRGEFIDRWINTCAQKDEQIDGLTAEVVRLRGVLLESLCALTSVTDNCHDIIQNDIYAECEEAILSARAVMKGPEA